MTISSVHNNYNPTTRNLVQFNTKQIIEKYNFKCVNVLIIVLSFSLHWATAPFQLRQLWSPPERKCSYLQEKVKSFSESCSLSVCCSHLMLECLSAASRVIELLISMMIVWHVTYIIYFVWRGCFLADWIKFAIPHILHFYWQTLTVCQIISFLWKM